MTRSRRRELRWALSIFVLCNVALLLPAVFEHGAQAIPGRFDTDAGLAFALWRTYAREALLAGRLPLWNPHSFTGAPFLAALQVAAFYPPNLLLLGLPTPLAMLVGRFLHLLLGQLGAYLLVRRLGGAPPGALLAGVAFGLGAQLVDRIAAGHVSLLDAQAWTPWLVLAALLCVRGRVRAGVLCGAAAAALQLTAGHPQTAQTTWFALAALVPALAWAEGLSLPQALRRAGAFLVVVPLLAAPLAAATLLPAFELASLSARSGFDPAWVGLLSFPPENAITLLAPEFFGGADGVPYWGRGYAWETTLHVSVTALVVAAGASRASRREALPWLMTMGWLAFLGLGQNNPAFLSVAEFVPTMDLFRGPVKFLIPLTLCLAVLAGLGLPRVLRGRGRGPLIALAITGGALIALFFSGSAGHAWTQWAQRIATEGEHFGAPSPASSAQASWRVARASLFGGLTWAAAALAVLAASRAGVLSRRRALRALVLCVVIELLVYGHSRAASFSMARYELAPDLAAALQAERPCRVALLTQSINSPMAHGLLSLSGYEAVLTRRTNRFYNAWEGRPLSERRFLRFVTRADSVSRFLGQRTLVTPSRVRPEGEGLVHVARIAGSEVWHDPQALPRAFLVTDAEVVSDPDALLARVVAPSFAPRVAVLLESAPPPPPPPSDGQPASPQATITLYAPEQVRVAVRAPTSAFLVLTDAYYPGWTATVGGREAKVLPAYGLVRAVRVPAGTSEVVFTFDSPPVRLGLWISALSILVFLGACWVYSRKRRPCREDKAFRPPRLTASEASPPVTPWAADISQ